MIVKHNKTDNLYQLIDDECKAKINGKWVDAVIYHGKDKETGKIKYFVRENPTLIIILLKLMILSQIQSILG